MEIPEETLAAALEAGLKTEQHDFIYKGARGITELRKSFLDGAAPVLAKWLLEKAAEAVTDLAPYNCELNPDGTEDRLTAAWVEGIHDSLEAIKALPYPQEKTPLENLAEAVWLSETEIEAGHVHEREES